LNDRTHGIFDLAMLAASMSQAAATWLYLSDAATVPVSRGLTAACVTVVLILAALTRNQVWAASFRTVTGFWLLAAPFALGFADIASAFRIHLTIGALVSTLAIPAIAASRFSRVRLAA
jgi:hypothetical protein